MEKKASMTALMAAFSRIYHNENHMDPVFKDSIARTLIADEEYEQMKTYIKGGIDFFAPDRKDSFSDEDAMVKWIVDTQLSPTPIARARFCEDSLRTAVQTGTEQYVILGAGLDTFAWRETELMKRIEVYEVDHPLTQEDKKERLEKAKLAIPINLHFIPMDFRQDNLKEQLAADGFDFTKKTFFSWLGVSYYLAKEDIESLLSNLASFAAEGSTLLFDVAEEELLSSKVKRVQNMIAMAGAAGEPMKFACDEMKLIELLDHHNFLVYEYLTPEDINLNYFHTQSDLSAFEHISYVTAVVKGTQFINTKEKILLAALKLMSQKGYEAVSVRDIASQVGITQAALYKHYQNKQDIFDQIVLRMEEEDRLEKKAYDSKLSNNTAIGECQSMILDELRVFANSIYHFWTEHTFASSFRKILTIEQYHSPQMMKLYQQYLLKKPLEHIEILLGKMNPSFLDTSSSLVSGMAMDFYGPIYLLMNIQDSGEEKRTLLKQLSYHVETFLTRLKELE